ncbi:MAG: DUF177 domain-containing protein [candidate division WOR-3 bacterium]
MKSQLIFNVLKIKTEKIKYNLTVTAEELEITNLDLVGPVQLTFELYRNANAIILSGVIDFTIRLVCSNCLKIFEQKFSEHVYQEYIKGKEPIKNYFQQLEDIDFDREYYDSDFINLTGIMRDTIELAIPLAPWCSPDCKGIEEHTE